MEPVVTVSADLLVILRVLLAFCWGIGLAVFLSCTRLGQYLAEDRTWLAVVAGVGADLAIGYRADWFTLLAIFAASSVGIIVRSLVRESEPQPLGRNRMNWALEDAAALLRQQSITLREIAESGEKGHVLALAGKALTLNDKAGAIVRAARRGEVLK